MTIILISQMDSRVWRGLVHIAQCYYSFGQIRGCSSGGQTCPRLPSALISAQLLVCFLQGHKDLPFMSPLSALHLLTYLEYVLRLSTS